LNVIENGSSKFTISTNGNTAITGNLGIGMTPSNILDITQTQNAQSIASLTNANASTAAIATFRTKNDAGSVCELGMFGSGYTPSGVFRASGGYVYANGAGGLTLTTGAAQPIYFGVNNAEVARFDTGGSLLINTSTTGGWPGNSKLEVKTTATSNTISAWNASSGGTAFLSRVDNTAVSCLTFYYGASTQISYWSTNGSTSTFNNPSDIRFKTVAEKQFDYSGPIKAMQMVDFNWTETGASDFGGLAQQAYEAFADTPIRDVLVSKPQNPEDKWFMAPDYYGRIALWGVKDLYAENEALKATVANLTARLEALENK
jgi:hypothetical protein